MTDVRSLERRLNAISIGMWKMQVNLPKFRRGEVPRRGKTRVAASRDVWIPKGKEKQQLSFAQVVSGGVLQEVLGDVSLVDPGVRVSGSQEEASVLSFPVDPESSSWLEGCYCSNIGFKTNKKVSRGVSNHCP